MFDKNKVKMYGDINYSLKAWQYLRGKTNGLKQRIIFMYKNIWYKVPKKPTKHRIENKNTKAHDLGIDIPSYHVNHPLNILISNELSTRPHINVLLPGLSLNSLSGGPNTALILAALLAEDGEYVRFISCDVAPAEDEKLFKHIDKLLNRQASRDKISFVDASDKSKTTTIGENDIFLATAWWTAQYAKYILPETLHSVFIYLIQDYEPILHEGGTFQAHAMETYGLHHIPVINTRLLLDHLIQEKAGCYQNPNFSADALSFEPALDRACFFPETAIGKKKQLLFYARPTVAKRNLFEIGVVALRAAVQSGAVNSNNWEVWAMGEKIQPVPLGNDMLLNPLPWMDFEEYSSRIRSADLALSLMLSPHPSYPPLEMSACGNLVVTNTYSVKTTERLKALSPNILGVDPNTESVANAIKQAAGRINAGIPSFDPLGTLNLPTNWDESLGKVAQSLLDKIKHLRKSTEFLIEPNRNKSKLETTVYEKYRMSALSRRRKENSCPQEPELLSFVTSAYNTDASFLHALASSIFIQDGGTEFEWLILDNGSTEPKTIQQLKEIEKHPCVRLDRVEKNLGIIGGMRYLLERASNRYILPLDSDDLLELDTVCVVTKYIQENEYPPLLYTDEDKFDGKDFLTPYHKTDWDPVLFYNSCYIAHLCAFDRKKAMNLGLYTDSGAEGCHDWDSFIRFKDAGYIPLHIPETLYSWRSHLGSTSGNITSKSYISNSHIHTLQKLLGKPNTKNIELTESPLFNFGVDWWFRRKRVNSQSIHTIIIGDKPSTKCLHSNNGDTKSTFTFNPKTSDVKDFIEKINQVDSDLVHLCMQDVHPEDDEWYWDSMGLFELFPDTVMVGGLLHDGRKVLGGPMVFGLGNGFDCPYYAKTLTDPGYGARVWKAHTVSAVSATHCVIKTSFLKRGVIELMANDLPFEMLGPLLGALATESNKRVVYSPFMRARITRTLESNISKESMSKFLSQFWSLIPDNRTYSSSLGLETSNANVEAEPQRNAKHLLQLQTQLLPYPKWIKAHIQRRSKLYQSPENPKTITLITTVYEKTNMKFLDELSVSVRTQTTKPLQWIIVVHGPISHDSKEYIKSKEREWSTKVVIEPKPLGIMGAMKRGLDIATGDYVVPVDADDLLTKDAVQILTNSITSTNYPELIYSDEDVLVDGELSSPYLRGTFDPVLNLESSYIWHLCAIDRKCALELNLYTDNGATWCHDWDSVTRIANAGGRIEHVPEVLYHWRQHLDSTSNSGNSDPRSLDSTSHLLQEMIAKKGLTRKYSVEQYPINRGSKEMYIARTDDEMPKFLWFGDLVSDFELDNLLEEDDIIVYTDGSVTIDKQSYKEVVRLLELHPSVAAVGGRVANSSGTVVDACSVSNITGERPWLGNKLDYSGPYALALKAQTVDETGKKLAFFRVGSLKKLRFKLGKPAEWTPLDIQDICAKLKGQNWHTSYSPLVIGYSECEMDVTTSLKFIPRNKDAHTNALARYGICCTHQV